MKLFLLHIHYFLFHINLILNSLSLKDTGIHLDFEYRKVLCIFHHRHNKDIGKMINIGMKWINHCIDSLYYLPGILKYTDLHRAIKHILKMKNKMNNPMNYNLAS